MTVDTSFIQREVAAYLAEDVECRFGANGAAGCVMPFAYPDGDYVVVWVEQHGQLYTLEERGGPLLDLSQSSRSAFFTFAREVAALHGCRYDGGLLKAECDSATLGEYIWHISTAAVQIAQAARGSSALRKRTSAKEREFVELVEGELVGRAVPIQRERPIEGNSGHTHRATIYLPSSETILEPVGGHWNQASSAFVKLADIRGVNGYHLFSMLDDRVGGADEDAANLLAQVSSVVAWSRRKEWFAGL